MRGGIVQTGKRYSAQPLPCLRGFPTLSAVGSGEAAPEHDDRKMRCTVARDAISTIPKIIVVEIRRTRGSFVKKYHRLHPRNLEPLAAPQILAGDQIVAANHV